MITEFPEVVDYNKESGLYGIKYVELIPILVKGMQQMQDTIANLKNEIETLISGSKLKSGEISSLIENTGGQTDKPYLEQNAPNPFSVSTTINFYIPQSTQKAAIYIYDMQGQQKKAYTIISKEKSSVIINGSELQAGMYLYTLIVDGKEIDTKKMILTQ